MLVRRYEMPWRRAYEVYAASPGGWRCSISLEGVTALPLQLALPLALVCFAMGVLRVAQALRMLVLRASSAEGASRSSAPTTWPMVQGSGLGVPGLRLRMAAGAFAAALRTGQDRLPGVRGVAAPAAALGYDSKPQPDAEIGLPYIHGVEPKEGPCTGRCRTSRAARCWSAPPSPARAWHSPT